jgi:ADP-ribosylglycohydrolase
MSLKTDKRRNASLTRQDTETGAPTHRSRTVGCLLGGAVGDALGAPVELMNVDEIRRRHGRAGVTRFELAYGRRGAITDDTQMTLFTAEGLILSRVRSEYAHGGLATGAVYHAYLRWLFTQDIHDQAGLINDHGTCAVVDGMLTGHRELFSQRGPGQSCLSALRSGKMGTMDQPVNNSKGCGGVMRVAPVGLAFGDAEKAFQMGCATAAITHGHPTGYLSAGFLAALISRLVCGDPLEVAIPAATRILVKHEHHDECRRAVDAAAALSRNRDRSPEAIETLGAGWTAEEALAIGIYCALVAGQDFRQGVLLAVNHSGDSDSTGSVTGNIIGAQYGTDVIPGEWLAALELKEVIEEVATDLFDQFVRERDDSGSGPDYPLT